jgi:hypothetical protein
MMLRYAVVCGVICRVDSGKARTGTKFSDIGVKNLIISGKIRIIPDGRIAKNAVRLNMRVRAQRSFFKDYIVVNRWLDC